jgi:hypothetical protein
MRLSKLLVPAVATIALLAGCTGSPEPTPSPTPTTNGVEELEAEEILRRATEALDEAGSFRLSGTGEQDGEATEVDIAVSGKQMQGSLTSNGFEIEFVVDEEGNSYLRGGIELFAAFLGLDLDAIAGKWIKTPPGDDNGLTPDVDDFVVADDHYTKGEVTEYEGQPAITLVDTDGTKLYISLVGEPYPLALVSAEGTLTFSDFGEDLTIEIPSADDVIDLPSFS